MKAETIFYWASILALIAGGCIYLVAIDTKATAAQKEVSEVHAKVDKVSDEDSKRFEEILIHLAHLDDALGR